MSQATDEVQEVIRKEFPKLTNDRDLCILLNTIFFVRHKEFLEERGDRILPVQLAALRYYKFPELSAETRYSTFTIKKKSGKLRTIHAPADKLKIIQQCLNEIFQTYYEPNANAYGFIPQRSITDGAELHTGKRFVFNIDLKDFFDSITFSRVKAVLSVPPFNLCGDKEPLARSIASLCCHPEKVTRMDDNGTPTEQIVNVLPQGAPTSPILTNLVCQELDLHLDRLAKRFNACYSRYADDITFSSDRNIFRTRGVFMQEMTRIIESEQRLKINPSKTRLRNRRQRQEVTGLVVNKKVNVSKRNVSQIRLWLHYWEKFGIKKAQKYFLPQYIRQRGNVKSDTVHIENVLGGKLAYMRMVVGDDNHAYRQLKERYDVLIQAKKAKKRKVSITVR